VQFALAFFAPGQDWSDLVNLRQSGGVVVLALIAARCQQPQTSAQIEAAPSLPSAARLVDVPFRASFDGIPDWQRELIAQLRHAAEIVDRLYWRQQHPQALAWWQALPERSIERRLFGFGGPWDRLDHDRPLLPQYGPKPAGRDFYPADLEKEQFEHYLAAHPEQRDQLTSPFSLVRREGTKLVAIPFHRAYAADLEELAGTLRRAAEVCQDQPLASWLKGRAEALTTDQYFASDVAWVELGDVPLEIVIGPQEVYEDQLWGVKASYQMAVGLIERDVTARLAAYSKAAPQLERVLPWSGALEQGERPIAARLVAVIDLIRAGDALHSGYSFAATNLPNDPEIQQRHGTRKLFFMSGMKARIDAIIRPVAARLLAADQLPLLTAEGYLHGTALHELAHALGPKSATKQGETRPVNQWLRERSGALEECKATVAGFATIPWLREHQLISAELERQIYVTELGGIFRDVRLGEAHADASTIALNWYLEQQAVTVDQQGRWRVDLARFPAAVRSLAARILEIQAQGDYDEAGRLIERYGHFDQRIRAAVEAVSDLPSEVIPIFEVQP
jgi:hypothetical protein